MTLEEAIAHERKEAEGYTKTSNALYQEFHQVSLNCQELANYHEQVAAWLEELIELKARPSREAVEKDELEDYQRGYQKGLKVGKKIGSRTERKMIIAYIEGKTIEEDQIEQMIKNGEVEAIPYYGETAEEEPKT